MNNALHTTIKKLAPAVLVSLIATSLGLLSLFQSDVPMIQDFGLMLSIGIGIAFLLALLLLLPILTIRTKLIPIKKTTLTTKPSIYYRIMYPFTRWIIKARYFVVILGVVAAGVGFYVDQDIPIETDMETFMPQDSEALADIQSLRTIIGSTDRIVILYESENITSYATLEAVQELTTMIETTYGDYYISLGSITTILNTVSNDSWNESNYESILMSLPIQQSSLLISKEDNIGIINMSLIEMTDEEFSTFKDDLNDSISTLNLSIQTTITGQSVVDQEMLHAMTSDRLSITFVGIGLVFLVLLVIYRNLFKALLTVIPIVLIVGWSGAVMSILGYSYTPLTSTLGALIIGIGTEFTILILMRYYDIRKDSPDVMHPTAEAVALMSKPIIVSAITTIGGFSALVFSDFYILSNFGIMTLINISLALLSSLIILPALLSIVGNQAKAIAST